VSERDAEVQRAKDDTASGRRRAVAPDASDASDAAADAATRLQRDVAQQARRMQRARLRGERTVWFSLGMMGMVGWSIALPTVGGAALGVWLDRVWPLRFSWTLTLLFVGAAIGSLNAWRWVRQESDDERD